MFTSGAARLKWFQTAPPMARLETFCNHYRRAAPDVNIFKFFHYRTVLDGWNGQIGALGVPGIAFGAVLGNGGVVVKCPDLAVFGRFYEIRRKRAWKAFQWGPVPPPSPHGGAWHPPGPDQPIWGLEWGGELINTVHWWGAPWGVFLTRIRFYPN
jgi:hypothetical protein